MKHAVIDIGSNSVRIAIFADGNIIYRNKNMSMLGEGLFATGRIPPEVFSRNLSVVKEYIAFAIENGIEKENIWPFATAAVRQAENGNDFISEVKSATGISVSVLSENEECLAALYGALSGGDGAVLDIGGASSELIVKNGDNVFAKSINVGAVKIFEACGDDLEKLNSYISEKVKEYGNVEVKSIYGIGGTATCLGHIVSRDKYYDLSRNHGRKVQITDLYAALCKIQPLTPAERTAAFDIYEKRAKTIFAGGMLLYGILKYLNLDYYIVSETDNLEGYYLIKTGRVNNE